MGDLPEDLRIIPDPNMPNVHCRRLNIPPINNAFFYAPDTEFTFRLPTTKKQLMNTRTPYIKFQINTGGATTNSADYTAASVFNSIAVMQGNTVLERVVDVNALIMSLYDISATNDDLSSSLSPAGTHGNGARAGRDIAAGTSQMFCVPLFSGILGSYSKYKYFPLGLCSAAPIDVVVRLETSVRGVKATAAASAWNISFPELVVDTIEFQDPSVEAQLYSGVDDMGLLRLSTNCFENIRTMGSGATLMRYNLQYKMKSLKHILALMRATGTLDFATGFSISARTHHQLRNYVLYINGTAKPDKLIQCNLDNGAAAALGYSEVFTETALKMRHAMGATNAGGFMSLNDFDTQAVMGVELECIAGYSNRAHTGISVEPNDVVWESNHGENVANTTQVDFYGFYDAVLVFNPATGLVMVDK